MNNVELLEDFREDAEKCLRCGLCQIVCPIFAEIRSEQSVARGKVQLIKELINDNVALTPRLKEIMSLCLNCGACNTNCPSDVKTDKLVLAARELITQTDGLPFMMGSLLHGFLPSASMQALAAKMAYFYQQFGIRKLVHDTELLRLISQDVNEKESLMPRFAPRTFRSILDKLPLKKGGKFRVVYFLSCMTNMVNPELGKSVIKVLEHNDC